MYREEVGIEKKRKRTSLPVNFSPSGKATQPRRGLWLQTLGREVTWDRGGTGREDERGKAGREGKS